MAHTPAFSFWCKRTAPPRVCLEVSENAIQGGVLYFQGNETRSRSSTSGDPARGDEKKHLATQISRIETFRCVIHPHPFRRKTMGRDGVRKVDTL